MIAVLNMMDEASKQGMEIDVAGLEEVFGIPVITTTAIQGKNIGEIIPRATFSSSISHLEVNYDHHVEAAIRSLASGFSISRIEALYALQGIGDDPELLESAEILALELERIHHMSVHQIIAGNRHHCAHTIAKKLLRESEPRRFRDLDRILTTTFPGIPILFGILVSILLVVFLTGSWMEESIVELMQLTLVDPFLELDLPPLVRQVGFSFLLSLQAGLGIAFPFVFTFYIFISILEDSGY